MTAPSRAYTPGTDVIDITAPGGLEQLLEFHRAAFGDAVMRANVEDPDDVDPDDDQDDVDPADDPDDVDPDDDQDDDPADADALGDKGKQALARMKEKVKTERTKRRQAEEALAAAAATDGDEQTRRDADTAATKKANQRILRSEIKAAAKGVLADPKDAFKFLDLDQFEVDEDGDVDEDEIAEAIDKLVTDKPYLAAQGGRRFQGTAGGGAGNRSRPKQLTKADIDRLTPEQIVEARRKGQLDGVLKGTR